MKEKLHCLADLCECNKFEPAAAEQLIVRHFSKNYRSGAAGQAHFVRVLGALLSYLYETQQKGLERITASIASMRAVYGAGNDGTPQSGADADNAHRRKKGTLLWVLDKTKTAMGKRLCAAFWTSRCKSRHY
jgi:DNA mismatch repair protein MutS